MARLLDMAITTWRRKHEYDVAQVDVFSGPSFCGLKSLPGYCGGVGKPVVLTLHGGHLPVFAQQQPGRVTRLLNKAQVVTAPSPFLYEQMKSYRSDLLLLPNAIDLTHYVFQLRARPQPRLIWLRAFHQIYNPSLAPRILAQLVHEFPDIQLIMVGPDKGDGSLLETQRVAAALGVAERIEYPGRVAKEDVPLWLNKGDIFLNTTHIDNTPISVMEAMACGLCVVSTNVGGLPYLLTDEQDALLIEPDSVEQGAAAIRRILSQPDLAAHLSQNAYHKVRQFDWPIVLKQWQELLLSLCTHA
ncbi:MAG: glycosyltransferase family 4 protein [Chloroflexi bacterium]|nr:glycosyltransferase family 4 protein [Chloroflexota bacterium]